MPAICGGYIRRGVPQRHVGNEPLIYFGGEAVLFTAVDPVQTSTPLHRLSFAGTSKEVLFSNAFFTNDAAALTETSLAVNLGGGRDRFTIMATHAGTLELNAGAGDDQIAIRSIHAAGGTVINADGTRDFSTGSLAALSGADVVSVGSRAGFYPTPPARLPASMASWMESTPCSPSTAARKLRRPRIF
jgi:hypothetical protein